MKDRIIPLGGWLSYGDPFPFRRRVVVSPCRPNGTVRVHSELWEASCTAGADVGDSVTIARLEGLNLIVVPAEREALEASAGRNDHPIGTM